MYDLTPIERQFGGFGGCDGGQEACGGDFAGIGGEDAVDFFPDLEFVGFEADADEGGAKIGVASSDLLMNAGG